MDLVEFASQILCQVIVYLLDTALSVADKVEKLMVENIGIGHFTLLQGVVNGEIESFECLRAISATASLFLATFSGASLNLLLKGTTLGQVII